MPGSSWLRLPSKERRSRLLRFAAGALSGWFGLVLAEGALRAGNLPAWTETAHLALLATGSATIGLSCLVVLHVLRRFNTRHRVTGDFLALGLVLIPFVYVQVDLLTAGDRISVWRHVGWMKLGLGALLYGFLLGVWKWHLTVTERTLAGVARAGLLAAGGVLALLGSYVVSFEVDVYAFFMGFLIPPLWLVVSTLFDVALGALPRRLQRGLVGASLVGAGCGLPFVSFGSAGTRARAVEHGRLAAFLHGRLGFGRDGVGNIRLDHFDSSRCASDTARVWSSLGVPAEARRHALIISIDALRKDAVGRVHSGHEIMPNLARFASRCQVFDGAVTTYPATLFGLGGAVTGLYPSEILLSPGPPKNLFTLARKEFPARVLALPDDPWFHMPAIAALFAQDALVGYVRGDEPRTQAFIQELRRARSSNVRTLGWIHYLDPHHPYEKREPALFGNSEAGRYLGEVHEVDRRLGELLAYLEEDGWFRDTLIVLLADHGQALGEAGYFGHHVYLNRWISDIPLMMYVPGLEPRRSPDVVAPIDVAATVLHWAGTTPIPALSGMSLFDVLAQPDASRTRVAEAFPVRGRELFELAVMPVRSPGDLAERLERVRRAAQNYPPRVSIVSQRYRFIANRETGATALFDRQVDLDETNDLTLQLPDVQTELLGQLQAWHEEVSTRIGCRVLAPRLGDGG